jgi:hypothetical protein
MAWTNIANANLDIGAPIRSVDILALRDNVSAVPNGDTGAPRIKAEALNGGQSGNAPIFAARAWVNFDGTGTFSPNPSTSKIRASGNVSSITKNATGRYIVNFTTAMQDANYCVSGSSKESANASSSDNLTFAPFNYSSSSFNAQTSDATANNFFDGLFINASVYR